MDIKTISDIAPATGVGAQTGRTGGAWQHGSTRSGQKATHKATSGQANDTQSVSTQISQSGKAISRSANSKSAELNSLASIVQEGHYAPSASQTAQAILSEALMMMGG